MKVICIKDKSEMCLQNRAGTNDMQHVANFTCLYCTNEVQIVTDNNETVRT